MNNYSKINLLLAILLLISFSSQAQNPNIKQLNEIKIEGAFAFTGTGDVFGLGTGFELRKKYKSGVSLAAGLSYFEFRYPNYLNKKRYYWSESYSRYSATALELTVYKSFGKRRITPEIGLGIIGRHWFFLDWYNYEDNFGYKTTSAGIEENYSLGYTASVGFNYKLNSKSKLNLRGVLQSDIDENILWSSRIGFARNF